MKREIPNPPYQGGKATEAIPRECPAGGGSREALAKLVRGVRGLCGRAGGVSDYNRVLRGLSDMRNRLRFGYPTKNRNDIERSNGLRSYARERE